MLRFVMTLPNSFRFLFLFIGISIGYLTTKKCHFHSKLIVSDHSLPRMPYQVKSLGLTHRDSMTEGLSMSSHRVTDANCTIDTFHHGSSIQIPHTMRSRSSQYFTKIILSGILIRPISALADIYPPVVNNPRGAFEMDMDFYIRNILGTSSKPDQPKKALHKSPRKISKNVAEKIFNIVVDEIVQLSGTNKLNLMSSTFDLVQSTLPYFRTFLPIKDTSFIDQYYFDISMYSLFSITSNIIEDSAKRVVLRKGIGRKIYNEIILENVKLISKDASEIAANKPEELVKVICANITKILNYFRDIGFILDYIFDEDDASDTEFAKQSFQQGLPVSFQIIEREPVLLISFVEMAAKNTFFHPEIIASVIAAYIMESGFAVMFEDYLMDNFYREENFNVQAQDVIIEMSIKPFSA